MKVRQITLPKARIEIIPMIDVIFFLLVFFMLSSLSMSRISSIPVDLPKTESSPQAIKQHVILSIKKDGSLYVNKAPAQMTNLGELLVVAMEGHVQESVIINADEGANYGLVIHAMDVARKAGIVKFSLASEPGLNNANTH